MSGTAPEEQPLVELIKAERQNMTFLDRMTTMQGDSAKGNELNIYERKRMSSRESAVALDIARRWCRRQKEETKNSAT